MSRTERQHVICQLVELRGECSVDEIAGKLRVSGMTVRRELQALADAGKVIRTHGGATMAQRVSFEFAFLNRARDHEVAKQFIGMAAANLVKEGQSVLLDSGTTTLAVARCLRGRKGIKVITTSLPIASLLQYEEEFEVLLLGGYLRAGSPDLAGALTESNLESLHADIAFIGAEGIAGDGSVFSPSAEVARMLGKMTQSAEQVYVVCDSSKLGKTALWRFGKLLDLNGLITDAEAVPEMVAQISATGANVILASALPASSVS